MLGSIAAYFLRRMLTLWLTVEQYGLLFSVIAFYSFFMLFVNLGLEASLTKTIVELRLKKKWKEISSLTHSIFGFQLFISLIIVGVILFFVGGLAKNYFHTEEAIPVIKFLAVWFITAPFIVSISGVLIGFQRTTWYTGLDFFRVTTIITITGILFTMEKGILAPLFAYALSNIILFVGYLPYVYYFFPQLFKFQPINTKRLKEVFAYGLAIAFTNFGWMIITQTDTFLLTYMTSLREVGLYHIALPISLFLLLCMRPISIVFTPFVTELAAKKKFEELSEAIKLAYKYIFMFLLPCALVLIVFPEQIISLLFSPKYNAATYPLVILAIGTVFYAFSLFNSVVYNGIGKAKKMAYIIGGVALLNIILNVTLIPTYATKGAAAATAISYILIFAISSLVLKREIKFPLPVYSWGRTVVCTILTGGIIYALKEQLVWNNFYEALVCGMSLLVVYTLLMYILNRKDTVKCYQLFKKGLMNTRNQ